MKHPSEATLALHAGGDLGPLDRWRTERHLAACDRCRLAVEEFAGLRQDVTELREMPGLPWSRLASEMKANIRLGLEAAECVRGGQTISFGPHPFTGWRALAACAGMITLVAAGMLLEHPAPTVAVPAEGTVLRATVNGIELNQGGQVLTLLNKRVHEQEVTYLAGAQGSMRARYVDADSGYVTINNVYGQ